MMKIIKNLYSEYCRIFVRPVTKMKQFDYKVITLTDSLIKHADLKNVLSGYETTDGKYQIFYDEIKEITHLRIRRKDMKPIHNWQHIQQIKDDLLGTDTIAIEVYPRKSDIVDYSNSYHLWTWNGIKVPDLNKIYIET
jgi:hypothetical protein